MSNPSEPSHPPTVSPNLSTAIARQAIVNAERGFFGYELFDRSQSPNEHSAASDAAMLFNVLSHADHGALIERKTIFINCTHQTLAGGHLELIQPERAVLEIPPLPEGTAEDIEMQSHKLAEISQRGFRLAFDESVLTEPYASWLSLATFIKIDISKHTEQALTDIIRRAQRFTLAQLIAEKVETAAQHEMLAALGISLFQGFWFAKPVLITGQILRPAQAAIIQLMNLVRKQASTAEIEDVLKREPTLSFNLLKFIN